MRGFHMMIPSCQTIMPTESEELECGMKFQVIRMERNLVASICDCYYITAEGNSGPVPRN